MKPPEVYCYAIVNAYGFTYFCHGELAAMTLLLL